MDIYGNFHHAINALQQKFKNSYLVHTEKWQGVEISKKPEMATYELFNETLSVALPHEDLAKWRDDIKPNTPWADDHFLERVSGEPLNPGKEWANWPYAGSADKFRDDKGQFNHNYMERYWPKLAGITNDGRLPDQFPGEMNSGVRFEYGDLDDVVQLLGAQPSTRQAFLPIFFPEDTGGKNGRMPCTLGYHFIMRNGYLHMNYYLRSCDFIRHFRDDIYLSLRLQLWMLEQLRSWEPEDGQLDWKTIKPGYFTMYMTSLHMFRNDYVMLFGKGKS